MVGVEQTQDFVPHVVDKVAHILYHAQSGPQYNQVSFSVFFCFVCFVFILFYIYIVLKVVHSTIK